MKKIKYSIIIFSACFSLMKAQVGVGLPAPNTNAQLDITSSSKGFLLPRIALTATNNASPLTVHIAGMTVYNTATNTSVAANPVYSGEYYNDGTQWLRKSAWNDVKMIAGGTITDMLSSIPIDVAAGTPAATTLSTFTFTLDRPSSVDFSGNISMSFSATGTATTPLGDSAVRLGTISFVFTTAPTGISLNSPFGDSSITYMNTTTANLTTSVGNFYAVPHATLTLPAGNYVVNLNGSASGSNAFRITYGSGARDLVQIKAVPTK